MSNTTSTDVNVIVDAVAVAVGESVDVGTDKNDARPDCPESSLHTEDAIDTPVSAAEAFAKSCEEIKDFCASDDEELSNVLPQVLQLPVQDDVDINIKNEQFRAKVAAKLNFNSCLPQIAIKLNDSPLTNENDSKVVLLNGNWDTSGEVPSIVAELHDVNFEELQVLKSMTMTMSHCNSVVDCSGTGLGGKQMRLEEDFIDMNADFSSTISPTVTSTVSVIAGNTPNSTTPNQIVTDNGLEGDSTDGNLSWLLNYKINELPPVPDQQHNLPSAVPVVQNGVQNVPQVVKSVNSHNPQALMAVDGNIQYQTVDEHGNLVNVQNKGYTTMSTMQTPTQTHTEAQYRYSNNPPTNVTKYSGPKKPPFTYTELIEHALAEKGELTVSGIYQWISDHFPFYKQNDDRWKNSVRHNLSINPHFRKGGKAVHGAGHLWTIAQRDNQQSWQLKRQKMQQFIKKYQNESSTDKLQEIELANATASILPTTSDTTSSVKGMQPENVAIEYVIDMSGGLGEQVVEECGLTGDYLIAELHPAGLGLNMSDGDILQDGNLYDDLNFHSYELQGEEHL